MNTMHSYKRYISAISMGLTLLYYGHIVPAAEHDEFFKSFVNHYDFRAEGRFTHEYHPFLLKKTSHSLEVLNGRLKAEGFNLRGHTIISGYEGNAIPSYYTNFREAKINDEMSSKSKEGWSLRLHNRFGLMTGYLFKDLNFYASHFAEEKKNCFSHINPKSVELFRDQTGIFQKHAFSDAFDFMQKVREKTLKQFLAQDFKGMLSTLINFWEQLYKFEITVSGNQSAATQDILFSIEYARYLSNSVLPISGYYVGGDITYPIEISLRQSEDATKNAQDFVKQFTTSLKAVDNQKTVYVFCSFVDGVGKSTMLGNIKNWMKFGSDVTKYERVDNSSSQYAEVFPFSENVYIADLPAQVSHFTYKPDGLVYVDAGTELDGKELLKIHELLRKKANTFLHRYYQERATVFSIIKKEGYFAAELTDAQKPHRAFLRNLFLLKKTMSDDGIEFEDKNTFIPFSYAGKQYVFDYFDPTNIRILRSLSGAASHGLKNIESEQMLFFEGIRFPLSYEVFLADLMKKLKDNGIENIIFVNFTSMYPRSCRENIRINYLIQQMALLDPEFDVDESLYKKFVNASELYAFVIDKETKQKVRDSFSLESTLRYLLYLILEEQQRTNLDGLRIENLTSDLKTRYQAAQASPSMMHFINECINNKMAVELSELENRFGLTKEFTNIAQFSFYRLVIFSDIIHNFFSQQFGDEKLQSLWDNLEEDIVGDDELLEGFGNKTMKLADGTDVLARYEFSYQCKDARYLSYFMRFLRSSWYATLGNILHGGEFFRVPPTMLKACEQNGQIYCIQKKMNPWEGDAKLIPYSLFHLPRRAQWGEFNENPYCLEWESEETNSEIFAFGCDVIKKKYRKNSSAINKALSEYKDQKGAQAILPTAMLLEEIKQNNSWQDEYNQLLADAQANGPFESQKIEQDLSQNRFGTSKIKTYMGKAEQREAAALLVRMLATLEMILKDPDADIVVRAGSKKDFRAALELFEKTTLPKYFGIIFQEPLFDDYKTVEPIIPWEYLKN